MPISIQSIENAFHWLGAIAGLGTFAFSVINMLLAQRHPTGQQTGSARMLLRAPVLAVATLIFVWLTYLFWKPLPFQLSAEVQLSMTILGGIILFPSLGLYLWGLRILGSNFNASSGFGVRLHQAHQLITSGPYAYLRHPMYLAVILACWGGLLIYRTWSMLVIAVIMFGLLRRAKKEEAALAQAFGKEWEDYQRTVPGWYPRMARRRIENESERSRSQ